MDIPHVDLVKEMIGSDAIEALQLIFENRQNSPPSVLVQRFRADHEAYIDALDVLENRYSLIERNDDCTNYLLRPYALPLIGTPESDKLLTLMHKIYEKFPELYREHLTQPLGLDMLCDYLSEDKNLIDEALYYISESHGIYAWKMIGFPYAQNSSLSISESVLSKKTIGQVLSEYYKWHFVNARSQVSAFESFDPMSTNDKSIFFSNNTTNGKPDWYDFLDNTKKALIYEIDQSLSVGLEALPTIGLRTLLETIMVEKINDNGTFKKNVDKFTAEGYVTVKMAESLSHVLDAGNASAHRAYFPSAEDIYTCVDLVKHIMHGVYILRPRVDKLAENTPKREGENKTAG